MYTSEQQNHLLSLARQSIEHYLKTHQLLKIDEGEVAENLKEKLGCFVTLTISGKLRGCIGHIEAVQPLYLDVIENAKNAAFEDPRFYDLSDEELKIVKIEVSVLSGAKPLEYEDADDLIKKLRPGKDGIILGSGFNQATFLPQVWEELQKPEDFLSHLCVKAGLDLYDWKKGDLRVKIYSVEKFTEQ